MHPYIVQRVFAEYRPIILYIAILYVVYIVDLRHYFKKPFLAQENGNKIRL